MSNPEDTTDIKESGAVIEESAPIETQAGLEAIDTDNLEKMILSTGIRVGTLVKKKFMEPFIVKANPEELYILDISNTMARVDVAATFICSVNIGKVVVNAAL